MKITNPYEGKTIKEIEIGDVITALGCSYEVHKILHQDYFEHGNDWDIEYFDIEFLDKGGGYHHYKSDFDHGSITDWKTKETVFEHPGINRDL